MDLKAFAALATTRKRCAKRGLKISSKIPTSYITSPRKTKNLASSSNLFPMMEAKTMQPTLPRPSLRTQLIAAEEATDAAAPTPTARRSPCVPSTEVDADTTPLTKVQNEKPQ